MRKMNLPDIATSGPWTHGFFDDFDHIVTADRWTTIIADSGSAASVGDAVGGILALSTSATDNDEAYITTTGEIFLVADKKPMWGEARVQVTEANTADANVVFGVAQEAAANLLVDDGAGVATTLDGAVWYKVDGGTRWQVASSNATTQTTTDTAETAGGSCYHTLGIYIEPVNSADAEVTFWIDTAGGRNLAPVRENGVSPRAPSIKHTVSISGMAEMHVVCGNKAGAANNETLNIDYIQAWQKR